MGVNISNKLIESNNTTNSNKPKHSTENFFPNIDKKEISRTTSTRNSMSSKVSFSPDTAGDRKAKTEKNTLREFTLAQVDEIKRLNPSRRYVIVSDELFDVTDFVSKHPGGSSVFHINNGVDVTETFYNIHPETAVLKLKTMIIGKIKSAKHEEKPKVEEGERIVTKKEIEEIHAKSKDNLLVIMFGHVYDISDFAFSHPGGFTTLWNNRGKECGDVFMRIHGNRAKKMVADFYMGRLEGTPEDAESPLLLNKPEKKKVVVKPLEAPSSQGEVLPTKHSSRLQTSLYSTLSIEYKYLSLTTPEKLPLIPGGHIQVFADEECTKGRYYTPYRVDETLLHICIKVYKDGCVSPLLAKKKMGDPINFIGPYPPRWQAAADPKLTNPATRPSNRHVLLAGAGTGVTPLYPIAKDLLERQVAQVTILLSIRTSTDVLLDMELEELLQQYGVPADPTDTKEERCYLRLFATLTQPPEGDRLTWAKCLKGRVSGETLVQGRVSFVDVAVICGPEGFSTALTNALLEKNLCERDQIHIL